MMRGGKSVKYSQKEIQIADPSGFSKISGYVLHFILTQVLVHTISISKHYTSNIVLRDWATREKFNFCIVLAAGPIFPSIRQI